MADPDGTTPHDEPSDDDGPDSVAVVNRRTAITDGGSAGESKARFEVYRDDAGEWRWRLVHDNGNIIADSGEGYDRKAGARKGIESVKRNASDAGVVVAE